MCKKKKKIVSDSCVFVVGREKGTQASEQSFQRLGHRQLNSFENHTAEECEK